MKQVIIRKDLSLEPSQSNSLSQKFGQSNVKLVLNKFHNQRYPHHNIIKVLLKEERKCIRLILDLLNQVIGHVWSPIQETICWTKEVHWLIIFDQFALIKSKNWPDNIKRIESIQVVNDVLNVLNASIVLKECLESGSLE